jgi:hypothetical protein
MPVELLQRARPLAGERPPALPLWDNALWDSAPALDNEADDWSGVLGCSALRPRNAAEARALRAAWQALDDADDE